MAYRSLYREYRPQSFNQVMGQKPVIITLKNSIKNNRISHAYLFNGPRGTGKTSVAKIFAKAVNCLDPQNGEPCNNCASCVLINKNQSMDIIEIDAASNNGVDEIRNLIAKVQLLPNSAKYKVYIIDEVHMLTNSAFNALLKTLEEPPAHVIFILATTAGYKLPITIISRCQRYEFRLLTIDQIMKQIQIVLKAEKINYELKGIELIARLANGSIRDALSLLEQAIAYCGDNIVAQQVESLFNLPDKNQLLSFLKFIANSNIVSLETTINKWQNLGLNLPYLTINLMQVIRDFILFLTTKDQQLLTYITPEDATSFNLTAKQWLTALNIYMDLLNKYKIADNPSLYFELYTLKVVDSIKSISNKLEEASISSTPDLNPKQDSQDIKEAVDSIPEQKLDINLTENEEINNKDTDEVSSSLELGEEADSNQTLAVGKEETTTQAPLNDTNEEELAKEDNSSQSSAGTSTKTINEKANEGKSLSGDRKPKLKINPSAPMPTLNQIINLLCQADKQSLDQLKNNWDELKNYLTHSSYAQSAHLLLTGKAVAATPTGIIIVFPVETQAKHANQLNFTSIFQKLLKEVFGSHYMVYAVSNWTWKNEVRPEYHNLFQANKLPKPEPIKLPEVDDIDVESDSESKITDKIKEIFPDAEIK